MEQIKSCPNCGSKNLNFYCEAKDRHYGNKGSYNLDECLSCQLVFINPMFEDSELTKFYPEDEYYSYYREYEVPVGKLSLRRKILISIFGQPKKKEESSGQILDIGCGNGWVLYQYKKRGWKVAGVEPSNIACEIGNKKDLNIFNGTLLDSQFEDSQFDKILSNHSFEHIYNPNETLKEINRILKPGGKLIIGVPNIKGINSRIAGQYWYYLGAPIHTFSYSPKNLSEILKKHGFTPQKLNYVSNAHGILGSIQIFINRNSGKMSQEGFVVNSPFLRRLATYAAMIQNKLRVGDCIDMIAEKNL